MNWPLQITFRRVKPTAQIEDWIHDEAEKLDVFYNHIMACRVAVELPHCRHRRGDPYHIRIDVRVPGGEVVVNRDPSLANDMRHLGEKAATKRMELESTQKNLHLAIKSAFRTLERRLQDYARCQRGDVKLHLPPADQGVVSRLVSEEGYGFLTSNDGREIYFHRNSVLKGGFSRLRVGTAVSFVEEQGEKGPQASTVRILESNKFEKERDRTVALVH
jgi:cold shock CspA family protein/ribosome-associated translation inhibitor RaiA